jgi:mannosyltransferase OCH1-like enzyme
MFRSDIWRLQVLMNYGGIYLDNDCYVANSLNKYLKYEMTVSWDDENDGLGVQVLIAHRNARLLKAHFDSYR